MKKLIVLLSFLGALLFAEKVQVLKPVTLRKLPGKESYSLMHLMKGDVYQVTDKKVAWCYVKVTGGSDHAGKEGWMWAERIKDGKIIIEGCCLRSTPVKDMEYKNLRAKVRVGASVEVQKELVTWVKIQRCQEGSVSTGWFYLPGYGKLVKE